MNTQEAFEANCDYLLEKFKKTLERSDVLEPMMNKSQLIAMYNAAAILTVTEAIANGVIAVVEVANEIENLKKTT